MILIAAAVAWLQAAPPPPAFDLQELAGYRLTPAVFERVEAASRRIGAVTREDPRYADAPLLTREILVAGDVVEAASELQRRLASDPAIIRALDTAGLTPREFTLFAIGLVAARLAHGFVETGVMRRVPPGVPADNVAFVGARLAEVSAVLAHLGIDDATR